MKVFFFLSGLVVTNSLLEKPKVVDFLLARIFRIWPGLILVVLSTVLFLGPLVSELSFRDYFSDPKTYLYFLGNVFLKPVYALPGVFSHLPHPTVVNGSLWTLPYEFAAYLALLALFMLGIFKSRFAFIVVFAILMLDPLTGNKLLFMWRPSDPEIDFLAPCFAMGAVLAALKKNLELTGYTVISLLILYLLFRSSIFAPYLFYASLFSLMLYLSGQSWMIKLKPRTDISYGVYLWGYPIQQTMVYYFPGEGLIFNQLASLLLAFGFGWISWHCVEKRGIVFGKKLMASNRNAEVTAL